MAGVPRLDKNAAMLAGALGAADVLVVVLAVGAPFSITAYFFLALGLAAMAWAAWSRVAAAYS